MSKLNQAERLMWSYLRDAMKGRWHVSRHEDGVSAGIPDVSYGIIGPLGAGCNGWLELKHLSKVPDMTKPLRIPHLRPAQTVWLRARGRLGGRCFLLVGWGTGMKRGFALIPWYELSRMKLTPLGELAAAGQPSRIWPRGLNPEALAIRLGLD